MPLGMGNKGNNIDAPLLSVIPCAACTANYLLCVEMALLALPFELRSAATSCFSRALYSSAVIELPRNQAPRQIAFFAVS